MRTSGIVSKVALAAILGSACGLGGCKETPRQEVIRAIHSQVSAKLDPLLTRAERDRAVGVVADMMRSGVAAEEGSAFRRAFGGAGMASVAGYMNQRIGFILSGRNPLSEQFFFGRVLPAGQPATARDLTGVIEFGDEFKPPAGVNASNIGALMFMQAAVMRSEGHQLYFAFGEALHPVTSSRIGIVQIADGFTQDSAFEGMDGVRRPMTWVSRSSTLVHEARHSDCTGGISADDVARLTEGQRPLNDDCSYGHIECPAYVSDPQGAMVEHPYGGLPVCDHSAWGANGMSLAYVSAIPGCTGCGEHETQEAIMELMDRMMRAPLPSHALSSASGTPDLSSRGLNGND